MRKLFSLFVALLATTALWAQRFQVGDLYYKITNDTLVPYTVEVTYESIRTANYPDLISVTIPRSVINKGKTYSVTSIGEHAFRSCPSLESITIPNSVTSIGEHAFHSCPSLDSITIPNSVTSIGDYAFYNCDSLDSITIPNSVTSIGDRSFAFCYSLASVTLGNNVTSIGESAFALCSSLTSINIPNSVTSIGKYAFDVCSSLTSITIGDGVTNIGDSAFVKCNSLDTIYCYAAIPPMVENTFINNDETNNYEAKLYVLCESLETYKAHAVWGQFANIKCIPEKEKTQSYIYYTSSDGNIVEPNAYLSATDVFGANIISNTYENGRGIITFDGLVTNIGESAFSTCSTLTNITIPNTVKHIGSHAFETCFSLNSIIIPNGVESIDFQAFGWCSSLESITIPSSVTYIGENLFAGCDSLASVMVDNQNPMYDSRDNCNAIIETATNTLMAGCKNTIIPNTVKNIGNGAFMSCYTLSAITIPNSVSSIGESAFDACFNLTSITIPNSVNSIGYQAFAYTTDLAEIIVESGNLIYDSREGCNAIIETATNTLIAGCKNTSIPNTIEHIGGAAFYGCQVMTSIDIPEGVKTIGEGAFFFCHQLSSISIPNSVTLIDGYAFYHCSSLTSITIPENITNVGARAFQDCEAIMSITWNAKNCVDFEPYEGTVPFYLIRSQITSFTFGDKVEHIPAYLCYKMDNLSSITIPTSVTSIGEGALAYCLYDTIYCLSATPPVVNKAFSSNDYNAALYTPCESLEAYKAHEVWGRFNTIQCLEDSIPDTPKRVLSCTEAVTICLETGATATTEAYTIHGYVTEITNEYSEQYKNISFYMADTKEGGQVLFTYRIKPMYEADIAVQVGDFVEVVGTLVNYNGYLPEVYPGVYTIVNEPELPTGTSDIQLPTSNTKKVVKDGQLLILRDGKTYTIMGAEVK